MIFPTNENQAQRGWGLHEKSHPTPYPYTTPKFSMLIALNLPLKIVEYKLKEFY